MALLKAVTFMAMREPVKTLTKEFKAAVGDDDVAKVKEIIAEVGKGARGRYKVAQDEGWVALADVKTLVNDRSYDGTTPLHEAKSREMKDLLIEHGAHRNREDLNGMRSDMDELGDALEKYPMVHGIRRRGAVRV